jgi:biotin-(acetyl-CoA carboxylase) ligase
VAPNGLDLTTLAAAKYRRSSACMPEMTVSAVSRTPSLPPAYNLVTVPAGKDAFAHAQRLAAEEAAEDGTVVWSRRRAWLDCAVVLAPEAPLNPSLLVAYAAMLGLGDGLGALTPPVVTVTFGWPDRLEVNGGVVGGVRVAVAEAASADAVPPWMVVAVRVAIAAGRGGNEPGHDLSRTTLEDEGCADIDAAGLLESFGRHFLSWINRWQDDGFGPVRDAWINRASGRGRQVEAALPGVRLAGRFAGIDDEGGLLLIEDGGRTLTADLSQALSGASWQR